jgi:hypothetical protein
MENTVPLLPGLPELRTLTVPSCLATIPRTTQRPSPVPPIGHCFDCVQQQVIDHLPNFIRKASNAALIDYVPDDLNSRSFKLVTEDLK